MVEYSYKRSGICQARRSFCMNVTIVGIGNIGTQFAICAARAGHRVTLFSSHKNTISKELTMVGEHDKVLAIQTMDTITDDPDTAFSQADLIISTVPAFAIENLSKTLEPYFRKDLMVMLVPGIGGGEVWFTRLIEKGGILLGLQRVPSVARLKEYGKCVQTIGYRNDLYVAAIPHSQVNKGIEVMEDFFHIKTHALPGWINLTMTPSNPILHTTRLKTMFENWNPDVYYPEIPLFYEGWTDEASRLLFACDDEVQHLITKMPELRPEQVRSLKEHYESDTPEALTRKIRSIAGFKGIETPMISCVEGYQPDFSSRYFTADFPFGLEILIQIADLFDEEVPNMKETLAWYKKYVTPKAEFSFDRAGIHTREDLLAFYSPER